jgi:hypothetical protein
MVSNFNPPYRILVSAPFAGNLLPHEAEIRQQLIEKLTRDGFSPQLFGELGEITSASFTFSELMSFIKKCQGVIVLGFGRHRFNIQDRELQFVTEYNHIEGILALENKIPLLMLRSSGVQQRGIMYNGGGHFIVDIPSGADENWLDESPSFDTHYNLWRKRVQDRCHLFLGYSSKAKGTAAQIKNFLEKNGVRILDWATDFEQGGTILEEIELADNMCLGGLFLFTKDDELVLGDDRIASPRDNVVFEAGYFINSKSDKRVLIIREDGAKMPADLGGNIYLNLKDRNDISSIETRLLKWVRNRL